MYRRSRSTSTSSPVRPRRARTAAFRLMLISLCLTLLGLGGTQLSGRAIPAKPLSPARGSFGLILSPDRPNGASASSVPPREVGRKQSGKQEAPGTPGEANQSAKVKFSDLVQKEHLAPAKEPKAVHSPKTMPSGRTAPAEVTSSNGEADAAREMSMVAEGAPLIPSPAASSSFAALEDNNTSVPPDTHGAVGPNHLMVTLNTQVRIQNRTGGAVSTVSLNTFWSSLGNPDAFDPKALYDPFNNRWIFTASADANVSTSSILIGVSETSDPTGNWHLYRVDADAGNAAWADFPSIGFNKDWIVVQVNMFSIRTGNYVNSHIYAFNKADLYAGGTGLYTLLQDNTGGFAQAPAITYDNTLSTMYLLETWDGNSGGQGRLRLSTITGSVGAEVLTSGVAFPASPAPWSDFPPGFTDFAPQLGSEHKIQTNDSRMGNLVYRNGSLWCAQTVFLPVGGATRSSVQWWELTPGGTVQQRGLVDDFTGVNFYAFPSIAVNKNSDVLIGYSRFSAAQFASHNYAFRASSDPLGTLRDDSLHKVGEAPYFKTFGGQDNRWGDYSNTVVDPANDTDLWTIQEYAAAPAGGSDRWGTWWARVVPPSTVCTLSLSPTPQYFTALGGNASFSVTSPVGCTWTTGSSSWINVASGLTGGGSGSINFSVSANNAPGARVGAVNVNGQSVTVRQGALFVDVPTNYGFFTEISKLSARGVTSGCGGGSYCPEAFVTREQMAIFLIRALGDFNPPQPGTQRFADVLPSRNGYAFIDKLAALGITAGCGSGNYCPDAFVTREQMAIFLIRALGDFNPPKPQSQRFTDVAPTRNGYAFIDQLAALHITQGCGLNLYCPDDPVTRAQMAAFLVRTFNW